MNQAATAAARRSRTRRPGYWVVVTAYFLGALTLFFWLGTPDSDRYRRLAATHDDRAVACRRLSESAQAAGRAEEAETLARSATRHDWLARAYRDRARLIREQGWNF